jgi:hypothetical protein
MLKALATCSDIIDGAILLFISFFLFCSGGGNDEDTRAKILGNLRSIETASKMLKERTSLIQAGAVETFLHGLKACSSSQDVDKEMQSALLSALYGGETFSFS